MSPPLVMLAARSPVGDPLAARSPHRKCKKGKRGRPVDQFLLTRRLASACLIVGVDVTNMIQAGMRDRPRPRDPTPSHVKLSDFRLALARPSHYTPSVPSIRIRDSRAFRRCRVAPGRTVAPWRGGAPAYRSRRRPSAVRDVRGCALTEWAFRSWRIPIPHSARRPRPSRVSRLPRVRWPRAASWRWSQCCASCRAVSGAA